MLSEADHDDSGHLPIHSLGHSPASGRFDGDLDRSPRSVAKEGLKILVPKQWLARGGSFESNRESVFLHAKKTPEGHRL